MAIKGLRVMRLKSASFICRMFNTEWLFQGTLVNNR